MSLELYFKTRQRRLSFDGCRQSVTQDESCLAKGSSSRHIAVAILQRPEWRLLRGHTNSGLVGVHNAGLNYSGHVQEQMEAWVKRDIGKDEWRRQTIPDTYKNRWKYGQNVTLGKMNGDGKLFRTRTRTDDSMGKTWHWERWMEMVNYSGHVQEQMKAWVKRDIGKD